MRSPSEVILLALKLTYAASHYDSDRTPYMCLAIDDLVELDEISLGESEAAQIVVMNEVWRISPGESTMRNALSKSGLSTADMVGFYKKFADDLRKSEKKDGK